HQSGIVLAATEAGIPSQAEGAVPAMEETGADLDEVAGRFPDQRTIGKYPCFVVLVGLGKEPGDRGLMVLGRRFAHSGRRRGQGFDGRVGLDQGDMARRETDLSGKSRHSPLSGSPFSPLWEKVARSAL